MEFKLIKEINANTMRTLINTLLLFFTPVLSFGQFLSNYGKASTAAIDFPFLNKANEQPLYVSNQAKPRIGDNHSTLYFNTGKNIITPEMQRILDSLIMLLKRNDATNVEVFASAENGNSSANGINNKPTRAEIISNYFVSKGIRMERVILKNFDQSNLIKYCDNYVSCGQELRKQNERAELRVIYPTFYVKNSTTVGDLIDDTYHIELIVPKTEANGIDTKVDGVQNIFTKFHTDGTRTYYSGSFTKRSDAETYQTELLKKGIKGNVVTFKNGGSIVSR